ncbi:MAG: hemin uptake protein HemP [Desulfobacteraceae bacterium]|nr:hemin uptake protein HemP [Desulfobacteraceae bacterium]MBU4055976.1 hemin uptake protein HemP [Pseudomonadota bacterium]
MPDSIQAETSFSYSRALFSDSFDLHAEKEASFVIEFNSIKDGEVSTILHKESGDGKKETKSLTLMEGDTLHLNHVFHVEAETEVRDDHPFPIKLEFKGQTYFLKRTKADKLILTK